MIASCLRWPPAQARHSLLSALRNYFKAYVISDQIRRIIETKDYTDLATNPFFSTSDFRAVPKQYRTLIPNYIKDYVPLNQFAA
jgi:type I restriction enzyme R subunit